MNPMKICIYRLLASLLLVTLLSGCAPLGTLFAGSAQVAASHLPRITDPQVPAEDQQSLAASNRAFALDLYHQLAARSDGNLVFSPYSISTALAMTYAGARGETAAQMAQVMHFDLPQERLHPAFNSLDQSQQALAQPGQGWLPFLPGPQKVELDTANSLWAQQGFTFLPEYLDTLGQDYGAGVRLVDYTGHTEDARQAINRWASDQTKGKIPELFAGGELSSDTGLVLANAVYFKAKWEKTFDPNKTHPGDFHLLDGTKVSVPMMSTGGDWDKVFDVVKGEGYQAVSLPYLDPQAEMIILVPDEGQFTVFEGGLDVSRLEAILGQFNQEPSKMGVMMPRFQSQGKLDLVGTLKGMGMADAFDGRQADFSGMDGHQGLFLSDVGQRVDLSVDEQGTVAVAVSFGAMATGGPGFIDINRSFIYLIYDKTSGTILFMGRLLNPIV
jgi:serpin B